MKKRGQICDVLIWSSALASGLYLSYTLGINHGFWGIMVFLGAGLGFATVVTIASMLSKLACRNRK
jgi:hypothetical protein